MIFEKPFGCTLVRSSHGGDWISPYLHRWGFPGVFTAAFKFLFAVIIYPFKSPGEISKVRGLWEREGKGGRERRMGKGGGGLERNVLMGNFIELCGIPGSIRVSSCVVILFASGCNADFIFGCFNTCSSVLVFTIQNYSLISSHWQLLMKSHTYCQLVINSK